MFPRPSLQFASYPPSQMVLVVATTKILAQAVVGFLNVVLTVGEPSASNIEQILVSFGFNIVVFRKITDVLGGPR